MEPCQRPKQFCSSLKSYNYTQLQKKHIGHFLGQFSKNNEKIKFICYTILNKQFCIKLLNNVTVLLKPRSCFTPVYRHGVISKNDKIQTIGFHSCSRLNPFTSSNNRYVPLRRGHRVCAKAKTNRVSLVSPFSI